MGEDFTFIENSALARYITRNNIDPRGRGYEFIFALTLIKICGWEIMPKIGFKLKSASSREVPKRALATDKYIDKLLNSMLETDTDIDVLIINTVKKNQIHGTPFQLKRCGFTTSVNTDDIISYLSTFKLCSTETNLFLIIQNHNKLDYEAINKSISNHFPYRKIYFALRDDEKSIKYGELWPKIITTDYPCAELRLSNRELELFPLLDLLR